MASLQPPDWSVYCVHHLAGHMVYLLRSDPPCLFSGDHIFVGGLGLYMYAWCDSGGDGGDDASVFQREAI